MTVQALYEALGRVETGVAAVRRLARGQDALDDAHLAEPDLLASTLARWQRIQNPSVWYEVELPVYEWWAVQRVFERVERALATAWFEHTLEPATGRLAGALGLLTLCAERAPVRDGLWDALLRLSLDAGDAPVFERESHAHAD